EVHGIPFQYHLLAGGTSHFLRGHVEHLLELVAFRPQVLEALGRLRFLEKGQQLAHFPQGCHIFLTHAEGHPLRGAEEVGKYGNRMSLDVLEQQRGAAPLEGAVADFGDFQVRVHCGGDAFELAALFEKANEVAQISVFHGAGSRRGVLCGPKVLPYSAAIASAPAGAGMEKTACPTPCSRPSRRWSTAVLWCSWCSAVC